MSYEKKLKDLMARLVSMSPEPPPEPGDTTLTNAGRVKGHHPALVFLGAVAIVVLLGVPLYLISGGPGGEPLATTTTTQPEPTTSVAPGVTASSTAPDVTATTLAPATWESVVYLVQDPENSFLGNPALIPVRISVTGPDAGLSADDFFTRALSLASEQGGDLPPGLTNAIPARVQIENSALENVEGRPVWVVDMNAEFLKGAGGLLADQTMLNQLVYTITQGTPEVAGVLFTVDRQAVETFGSEGIDLTSPITRDTYIDELNLIFLTEPILEVEHVYVVAGMANTFEASLTVGVTDGSGQLIHSEPVQATCGTGCWGEFGVGIDNDLITPGVSSITLFTQSPRDGSIENAITVPVAPDAVWNLTKAE